jgi:hypothetical protein
MMKYLLGVKEMGENVCCFFGHREIDETAELQKWLSETVEMLIAEMGVDTFLFGSKSKFNTLCHKTVTAIKKKYPNVKRVYVRAEYQHINESYEQYLLKDYEQTYYPERIEGAGKAVYVQRNYEMIDRSRYCIVYYDEAYMPKPRRQGGNDFRKSGTKIALEYARRRGLEVFVFTPHILSTN